MHCGVKTGKTGTKNRDRPRFLISPTGNGGLSLRFLHARTRERLQMLLLIGHLAAFVQRLIGEEAKAHQLQLDFMATHRRQRPEISTLTLARRILLSMSPAYYLDRLAPWAAIPPLRLQAINAYARA